MVLQSVSSASSPLHSCGCSQKKLNPPLTSSKLRRKRGKGVDLTDKVRWAILLQARACGSGGNLELHRFSTASPRRRGPSNILLKRFSDDPDIDCASISSFNGGDNNNYFGSNVGQYPTIDKLSAQLGAIHPFPWPLRINSTIFGLFAFFFFVGVAFDKAWTSRKSNAARNPGNWPKLPTTLSMFLDRDLQRKESVEWVNMVLGKLWRVYRSGIENWIIGLLQPLMDDLRKPDYVQRVEIKQFSLGDEPLSVRSVERRTSRRDNDLQYQIGLRYTGGALMLLSLSLKFGVLPVVVPVTVSDFDIDGELWVKLRLIPTEPWVGAASWAFVSLPKIKFDLSAFSLFNIMAIPVLSAFLTKLLTVDLPRLFVRPKKIVLDFQKGKAVVPVPNDFTPGKIQERINTFSGELSVTLLDARKLSYIFYGKTDPYVVLRLGGQVIRSKKNSQTTIIGPPGEPIWNQDFHMLVADPRKDKLCIEVKDTLGFTDLVVGTSEVNLESLKDTVPEDRIVALRGGWNLFGKGSAGEILLRLTYKAYVEDDEDERFEKGFLDTGTELSDFDEFDIPTSELRKEPFMDLLSDVMVSEQFQGIVTSETTNVKPSDAGTSSDKPGTNARAVGGTQNFESNLTSSGGSILFWFALITSVSVLIAYNIAASSLFNPWTL